MSTYNSMSGLPTGASSSEAMAMNFPSAHSTSMNMDVFDQDITFDESLLYVLDCTCDARATFQVMVVEADRRSTEMGLHCRLCLSAVRTTWMHSPQRLRTHSHIRLDNSSLRRFKMPCTKNPRPRSLITSFSASLYQSRAPLLSTRTISLWRLA